MDYRKTAIFSDLDGTLFNSDSRISERNLSAIRAYTEAGGLFAIATGRCFSNSVYYMRTYVPEAPSIVFNGSAVFDPVSRTYPYRITADLKALTEVLVWCREQFPGMDIQAYGEQDTYYLTPPELATKELVEQLQPCTFTSLEQIAGKPLFKTLHYGQPEETKALYRYLVESGLEKRLAIVRAITGIPPYHEHIELLPMNVNKGTALDACRSLECYRNRTLFGVGDYRNDLELLEHADIAVCPSNASEEIRSASDHVLASNDEDAIADLIERLIPSL